MEYQKLNKDAKTVMFLAAFVNYAILWGIAGVAYYFNQTNITPEIQNYIYIGAGIFGVLTFISVFISPFVRYARYRYLINEEMIDVQEGFLWVKRWIVPIERVRHITLKRGPIDNIFKLSKVVVTTAGGDVEIKFLKIDIADKIADDLKNKINIVAKKEINEV